MDAVYDDVTPDLIAMIARDETPLLDIIGDAEYPALSTKHDWIEDSLNPNRFASQSEALAADGTIDFPAGVTLLPGDILRPEGSDERILVESIDETEATVVRGYGGTSAADIDSGQMINVIGNAALEGGDAASSLERVRTRRAAYSQIFTKTVKVSGTAASVRLYGTAQDEYNYQLQIRLREALRDLENTVINGVAPASTLQGASDVRRTINGIDAQILTNVFTHEEGELDETELNEMMKALWDSGSKNVDVILVNGIQKRAISSLIMDGRGYYADDDVLKNVVGVYESDFGIVRVVLCRWLPADEILFLDSSRIKVVPVRGRAFQHKPLGTTGDYLQGQVIGEYVLEFRNENAHGKIVGLPTA
jgi:hypothetical protein